MEIRKSTEKDFDSMLKIYRRARAFMAENGNPNQWGPTNWPPEELLQRDIAQGKSYVCTHNEKVIGTFFFDFGKDIENTYIIIEDGKWVDDSAYGVIHRLAGSGEIKGTAEFIINWAYEKCGHLRVDTHGDNKVIQNIMKNLDFVHCGTIYVEEDNYPRLAYEKSPLTKGETK